MMKNSFQETKKSNFLYYGIILVSVLVEVIMIWQLEKLIPLLYPGFIGFLVFHLLYHLVLFLVAKRSGRWDYLMIWGAFPHVQSSLWLLFRFAFSRFIFWYVMCLCKTSAISPVLTSLLVRFFFYLNLVKHFSKLVAFSF